MRNTCWSIAGLLLIAPAAAAPEESKVAIQVVNYDQLGKVVKEHTGQVVLLDFWGIT
jgi:hypothetical protein